LVLLLLQGCASNKALEEASGPGSLVFGYMGMDESPAKELTAFSLRQVLPKSDKPYLHMRIHEGVFYIENVAAASYQMNQFGGPGGVGELWLSAADKAYFPAGFKVDVRPADRAVYIGTLRYRRNEFFQFTKRDVVDDYERANAEFRKKFGSRYALRKSLAALVNDGK